MKIILNSLDISSIPEFDRIFEGIGLLKNVKTDRDLVLNNIKNVDAYLASAAIKIDKEFLNHATNLKVIGSPSTGTDHMDLNLIAERGIKCFDISEETELLKSFTATSELAFSLLLSLLRKNISACNDAKNGIWSREKYTGLQLYGKVFGILGLGRLGKISARIANGFGMKVIAHDIKDISLTNVEMVNLNTLAQKSDFISIHIHLNKDTEGLVNMDFLKKMKKNSVIINTSRGKIINELDLLYALQESIIAGAALDVIDGEWLTKQELYKHPLIEYSRNSDKIIISPHIGGATIESIYGARLFMAKKVANFLSELD
tara:strand:+ start:11103 stop:12053 length:951 start_codon:yes stop_codon:yes gene_type:complete